nr:hypothetical protein [uncultured Devosia sp.]
MLVRASLVALFALVTPTLAEEIACEGAFAIDSSEARLIELYGADNVVTGIVPGPEGSEMLATTVFPGNAKKTLQFVWWDEDALSGPSYIELPPKAVAPGGLRAGMSLAQVEAINGEPFTLLGFGWDYGGSAGFESGALSGLPGDCMLSLNFDYGTAPEGVDTLPAMGDKELSSDDPLLAQMQVRLGSISVGYPHPDFR